MESNCIFCKIVSNEFDSYKLYEDNNFVVIFDKFPANFGHTLVLTRNHYENFFELDEYVASELLVLAQKVALALKEVTGCDGINIMQNNGKAAGQEVMHYHLHVIPRYENDDVKIKLNASTTELSDEKAKELLDKIRYQLEA